MGNRGCTLQQLNSKEIELSAWSCNPEDIPDWSVDDKKRLIQALSKMFGWDNIKEKENLNDNIQ